MKLKTQTFLFKNQLMGLFVYSLFFCSLFCFSFHTFAQGIQNFTPDQIRSLLTPKQVKALTERQIGSLTPAQISAFTPQHIKALKEDQLKAFKPDQMRGFQPSHFTDFSESQLRTFEPRQVGAWNALQVSGLRNRISLITEEQLTGFQASHIKALDGSQIRVMSSDQLESLKPSQIQGFQPKHIRNFTEDQIESFSASDILKFSSDQISQGLHPRRLQLFDRAKLQALGPEYIRKLKTVHIAVLNDDHIETLKDIQIQAFTPPQAKILNREQIRAMSAKQLRSLNSGQLKQKFLPKDIPNLDLNNKIYGLDEKQIGYLTPSQKQDLIKQQYNGLSLRQFQALTPEQIRSIDPEVLRGLSANKLKSLTPEQIQALTPEQLNTLKNNQLALFDDDKMIDEQTAQSMDDSEAQALCFDIGPNGCNDVTTLIGDGFSNICETLLQSPLCKDVPDDKKKDCSGTDSGVLQTPYNMIWGCLKYSVGEILKAMWGLLKWVGSNLSDTNAREETGDMASRAMDSVKLYLHSEYEKAYEDANFPGKSVKAAIAMGGSLAKLLYDSIADTLSEDVAEWSCLNTQGKSGKICGWLLALAPVGGGAVPIVKALSKLPAIKKLDLPGKWNKGKEKIAQVKDEAKRKLKESDERFEKKRQQKIAQKRIKKLRPNIEHPDIKVRKKTARDLAAGGDTQSLMRMAGDDAWEVREAVAKGLAKNDLIGRQDSIDIVKKLNQSYVTGDQVGYTMQIANRLPVEDARTILRQINNHSAVAKVARLADQVNPALYKSVLNDIVDRRGFSKTSGSIQRDMVEGAVRLQDRSVLERISARTQDPIIRDYANAKLSPPPSSNVSSVPTTFREIFTSYARSPDKQKKFAAIDHIFDSPGSTRRRKLFIRAGRSMVEDSDPAVRRYFMDTVLRRGYNSSLYGSDVVSMMRFLSPADRRYFIQQADEVLKDRPFEYTLKEVRQELLNLESQ